MTSEGGDGRTVTEVNGTGERFSWPDPRSADTDVTFTVKVQGAPAPAQTAQTYRFLMPKVCGNIAYLGEGPERTVSAAGAPQSCEDSVSLDRCVPTAPAPDADGRHTPRGTPITVHADTRIEGAFDGLENDGSLRLRLEDGSLRAIYAGDVILRENH